MSDVYGLEGAGLAILDRVKTGIASELALIETQQGLAPGDLDNLKPRLYTLSDRERLEPTENPAVMLVGQSRRVEAGRKREIDPNDDQILTERLLTFRMFVAYRGTNFEEVSIGRYRLMDAAFFAVLRRPRLADNFKVDSGGWEQSFSGLSRRDGRTQAGAYTEFTGRMEEVLGSLPTPLDDPTAVSITVDVQTLTP